MKGRVSVAAVVTALATASLVAAQVAPSPPAQAPPAQIRPANPQVPARDAVRVVQKAGTGALRGRIVAVGGAQALRHARISLTAPGVLATQMSAMSDGDGRFEFTQLPAGRFTILVQKPGYVDLFYGQRHAREPGKPIDLAEGQVVENLEIALPRGAVIAGRVVDDAGDPLEPIMVTAMQSQYFQGRRRLVPVSRSVRANDLGHYRIYGLPPGTYYVGTMSYGAGATDEGVTYAQSFYPGTADMAEAQPVAVKTGQEQLGVDFAIVASRTAQVSGVVYDSRGRPAGNVRVSSSQMITGPTQGSVFGGPSAMTQADGRFTFANLGPGEHELSATVTNPDTGEKEEASASLTVTGVDVDGLALTATVGSRVTGRFRFDASAAPPFPASKLSIRQGNVGYVVSPSVLRFSASIKPDWTFELRGVGAGRQTLQVAGLPAGWMLKSILQRGRDVADTGLDVPANQDVGGVEIVLTDRASEISGAVTDEQGQPVADYTVVVFPEDPAKWIEGSRLLSRTRPDQNGRFTVRGLPPGKYCAMAVEYVAQGDSNDPEWLRSVSPHVTHFALEEGEKKVLDLKLIQVEG
jgi:hypothetical protein